MDPILRQIDTIVIHCSDSPNGRNNTATDIDAWHKQRGFYRTNFYCRGRQFNPNLEAIGYHYVITLDGKVQTGRHPNEIGAHVQGHNSRSLGICLIGTDKFTPEQWAALGTLVQKLKADIGNSANVVKNLAVVGYYQLDHHKQCPCFDVPAWLQNDMIPQAKNIYLLA